MGYSLEHSIIVPATSSPPPQLLLALFTGPARNRLGYCPRQEQARLLSETIAVVEQRTGNMLFCNLFCILRASCLMLEIKEFRCYEMKTETTRRLPVQYI